MKRIIDPCHEVEDLGGGRHRLTAHLRPIAYRRAGAWQRITSVVGATGDPSLPFGVDELFEFRVRDRLAGASPVLHFGKGSSHVRITPLGTNNVAGQGLGTQDILFRNAWDNVDLHYLVGGHLIRKEMPLRTGHPSTFSFRIDDHAGLDLATLSGPEFRVLDPVLTHPTTGLTIPLSWMQSQQGGKTVLTVTLPAGDFAGWVLDPTLTLQPAAAAGKDAYVSNGNPSFNSGTANNIQTGNSTLDGFNYRSLLQFDVSSIPASMTVTAASLDMTLILAGDQRASNNRTHRLYRILQPWTEAGVTWATYDGANNWQTAGCSGANDVEASGIGSCAFATTDSSGSIKTFSLTTAGIQGWVAGTLTNNGLLWRADTESNDAYRTGSSDHATAANRPKLVVEYTEAVAATRPSYLYVGRNLRRPT